MNTAVADTMAVSAAREVALQALGQKHQEPQQFIQQMTETVHQFVGDAEQSDDLTMMAIQYIKDY